MTEKFTVLIPTRERCETLVHTLASVTAQDYDNLDIVVSDNMSADATRDVVEATRDPRVRYVNTGRRLSMTGNFEFSLGLVGEGFVMHLGDDDALVPGAVSTVARIAAETGLEAIASSEAMYHWPSALDVARRGRLVFSTRPEWRIRRSSEVIQRVIAFEWPYVQLPSTYNSFIHRRVIDRASRDGRYYHSRTPDSYSGLVNAAVTERFVTSGPPFAIAGVSGRSNGGAQWAPANRAEADLYEAESDLPFHPEIVFAPSLELIVAEVFLQARARLPELQRYALDMDALSRAALREATPATWEAVARAVSETRTRAGLAAMLAVLPGRAQSPALRRAAMAAKVRRRLERLRLGYQQIDAGAFGVCDINAAGRLARTVGTYVALGYAKPGAAVRGWKRRRTALAERSEPQTRA